MTTDTYKFDRDDREARRRLARLEATQDPGTIGCLERLGVAEGWHCLEVGAGGGSIAAWLKDRVGDAGRVVATDLNTRFLEPLQGPGLEVRRHDVAVDDLEEAAFDLVHARDVLVHVPERVAVMRKLAAAVKPGGWICLEEPDVSADGPDPTVPDPMQALYARVTGAIYAHLRHEGLDPEFGASLLGRLRGLGFESLHCEGRLRMYQGGGPGEDLDNVSEHMLAFAELKDAVVAEGTISRRDYDAFLALPREPAFAWREGLTMTAWGRKP